MKIVVLLITFSFISIVFISPSYSGNLEDWLKSEIIKSFKGEQDLSNIAEEYGGLTIVGDTVTYMDKSDVIELHKEYKADADKIDVDISGFNILSKYKTKHFTSVVYEFEWKIRYSSMKMEGKSILHSIFINKDDGWNYLFDAASG
tara:strand:- start:449 stop:886 length:438 start_codon:yes stop_codon:yes gene_type:complete